MTVKKANVPTTELGVMRHVPDDFFFASSSAPMTAKSQVDVVCNVRRPTC